MAKYKGKDVVMKIGSTPAVIEQMKDVTIEASVNLMEDTCIGQDARTRTPGLSDYSIDFNLFLDSKSPVQATLIEGAEFDWEGYFEGTAAGQLKLSGTAIVESVSITGEVDGIVTKAVKAVNNDPDGLTRGVAT